MGIRKNAKFLSATEQENFVKACVMMKAEIVNPAAPLADQYSRWDEYVAIHWMIQDAFAPGDTFVNFGHGGSGSYSFLSWHRFFLFQFEKVLQGFVPGVMLPYWDWADPAPIMTDTFLGPDGTTASEVRSGYFARFKPGTPDAPATPGGNPTPLPVWWPASLNGWIIHSAFGSGSGALRRDLSPASGLPTADDLREALAKTTYPSFQNALEGGVDLTSGHQMHNELHGWVGGFAGQMSDPRYSPADPIFYLHHCNIDRLWAMWQMDGHADVYPSTGGQENHRRNDIMYPWTGGAAGYGTDVAISSAMPMPDFSALGAKRNVDTLDYRTAFDYTYDTLAVIGLGLDRTGSMNGLTPDPMTVAAPDVTKWEAAKRGVSAFLQDCETVQESGVAYVWAGIKTFRSLAANDFTNVFSGSGSGLVKTGGSVSRSAFESAVASMTPGGGTPLADALLDVQNTLVEPPFGHVPADEQRYLAMLTDGLLTTGAPLSSIPDNSFAQTVVFAMGFGTGADVDYPTLATIVAKGKAFSLPQVFHGENAGTIDNFYNKTLSNAIGFTPVFDPVIELFAGEHTHIDFYATSADDVFLITAQGMDFDDDNWTFHLHGPGGYMAYGAGAGHGPHSMCGHCCNPAVTAKRGKGRLSVVLQRNNTDRSCWVGRWRLMIAYKAQLLDAMVMPEIGELIRPVSAGPVRGSRFARLLVNPKERVATRSLKGSANHRLDTRPLSTNRNDREACSIVVNISARTRLRIELVPKTTLGFVGEELNVDIRASVLAGTVTNGRSFARLISPARDIAGQISRLKTSQIPRSAALKGSTALKFDPARVLASLEKKNPKVGNVIDQEVKVAVHDGAPPHVHFDKANLPGTYHLGIYLEGTYCPEHNAPASPHHDDKTSPHDHAGSKGSAESCGPDCLCENFNRVLTVAVAVAKKSSK